MSDRLWKPTLFGGQQSSNWVKGRNQVFVQVVTVTLFLLQLSVYTTTRSNIGTENNVDLVLNVENFDVETKFERYSFILSFYKNCMLLKV